MKKIFFVFLAWAILLTPLFAEEGINQKELKSLLGDSYMIDQDYDQSVKQYREILEKDPRDIKVRTSLADVLSWQKKYDESIAEYQEVLKIKPADLEVKKRLANVFTWKKDYLKAQTLFQELIEVDPQNERLKISLAEVQGHLGKTADAERLLRDVLNKDPANTDAKILLGDIYAENEDFDEAIVLYQEALNQKYDRKVKAKEADVLSWTRRYREALQMYDELLAEKEDSKLRLQKARILGWGRKYGKAAKEYQKILDQAPNDLVRSEMEAKHFYWNNRVKRAIKAYRELIQKTEENAEAMFDLSQVYSYQSMWKEAIAQYKEMLNAFPAHFRAKTGLAKSELLATHPGLTTGYEFFKANSGSRDVNIHKNVLTNRLYVPLTMKSGLELGYDYARRTFNDFHSLTENQTRVALNYRENPDWSAAAFFNLVTYLTSISPVYEFGGQFAFRTFDIGQMTLSAEQLRLENNSQVIRRRTMRDNFKVRQDVDINIRWKAGADYTFTYFTDHNHENEVAADTLYFISLEPRAFYVKYRYAFRNYARRDDFYYAPHNYSLHAISARWKHFLNKKEIFFGANDIYYEAGYDFLMDSTGIIGHQVMGGLGWDITKRLQIKGEGQYTHSTTKIYEDAGAKASVKYLF